MFVNEVDGCERHTCVVDKSIWLNHRYPKYVIGKRQSGLARKYKFMIGRYHGEALAEHPLYDNAS